MFYVLNCKPIFLEMVSSAVPVGLKSVSDEAEVLTSEKQHSVTKEDGLSKHKIICDNIILYLTTNSLPHGLTKNGVRNIKNQAKTHRWVPSSKFVVL